MTKQAFMDALTKGLSSLSKEDRERIVEYYSEMISDRMEDGLSEEAAVADVGNWEDIAQQILSELPEETESSAEHHVYINGMSVSDFIAAKKRGKSTSSIENIYEIQEPFSHLRITAGLCDVSLLPAKNEQFRLVHKGDLPDARCRVYVEKEILHVERQAPSRSQMVIGKSPAIEVYLPQTRYQSVEISTGAGDIDLPADFTFSTASLKTSSGDIELFCTVEGDVDLSSSSGDIKGRNLRIGGNLQLISTSGDVRLQSVNVGNGICGKSTSGDMRLEEVRTTSLSMTCTSGDVELEKVSVKEEMVLNSTSGNVDMVHCLSGALKLTTTSGDVEFESCDARSIWMHTTSGEIEGSLQTGKTFVTKTLSGSIRVPASLPDGDKCALQTLSGDIRITVEG